MRLFEVAPDDPVVFNLNVSDQRPATEFTTVGA
jgi:hypothetical protein